MASATRPKASTSSGVLLTPACVPGGAQSVHSRGIANEPRSACRRLNVSTPETVRTLQNEEPLATQRVKRVDDFSSVNRHAKGTPDRHPKGTPVGADQARFLNRQLSLPVSTMSQ